MPNSELSQADVQALHAAEAEVAEGLEAGDTEAMMDIYLEDAVVMPPGAPAAEGREAIREELEAFPAVERLELTPQGTDGRADLAYVRGTYQIATEVGEGGIEEDTGTYLTVWQRDAGGSWRIVADIWNSNQPPSGA